MKSKNWIVVVQYGGYVCVRGRFDEQRPAMDFMDLLLNADAKRTGRGARLTCHVYQLFGSYSN